ncbi:MAG: transcriptional repressor LexA [Candidatus Magasanikbacteria bacterium]
MKPKKSNSNVKVPILGLIRAGEPIEPVEESEPYQVPKEMLSESGDHFALKVEGQSMVEEGIQDGDIVILRDQPDIENGQTAAVYIPRKNEATLKKVYKEKDKWKLQPANPNMDPFYEKNIEVRGKVINIIRNFA